MRNPALASHAFHLLPYRGLGSGIPRATTAWPEIEFVDDRLGQQFKVVVRRQSGRGEGVSEGVTLLLRLIERSPGLRAPTLARQLDTPVKTVERWLRQLKAQGLIEFRGAPRTGGYHLSAGASRESR